MDERTVQLKCLKKQYKKTRRRATFGWKYPAVLFVLLGLVLAAAGALAYLPENPVTTMVDTYVWGKLLELTGLQLQGYVLIAAAACGAVALLLIIGWRVAAARAKKTEAYYNWQTMYITLKTEKQYR